MQSPATQADISIPHATITQRVWLRVGTLVDGESPRPLRRAHLVYDADTIVFVGDEKSSPPRPPRYTCICAGCPNLPVAENAT